MTDLTTKARIPTDCKFAFLGLTNVRVDIPNAEIILPDGTHVFTRLPIELDSQWQSWLGIQASQISGANLVLVRTTTTGFAPEHLSISDNTNLDLAKQIENIFTMLRLLGTIEYESAFLVIGHVQQGHAICQNLSKFERLEITRGCLPWIIREEHLAEAATLAQAKALLLANSGDVRNLRLFRGWWALTSALQQFYASERIHGFVRALEALIYPQVGKTEKQFIHRCSLFAAPSAGKNKARDALEEAYKMRCDVEHVHQWDRSLVSYPCAEREDIAYWRTRQMESLACLAYAKIFADNRLHQHFQTDPALEQFWRKPEHEIRLALGTVCDITELKLVRNYDGWGRAAFSEWPSGWRPTLERRYGSAGTDTFRAVGFSA
jgi:hypothetical protein